MSAAAKDKDVDMAEEDMVNEGGCAIHDIRDAAYRRMKERNRDAYNTVKNSLKDSAQRTDRQPRNLAASIEHVASQRPRK